MNKRERSIVYGSILGDAFIQPTGKKNARIRLEHGARQKEYILWKWQELKRYMQRQPTYLDRFNPIWRKRYAYYRCQSHASPEFGKLRLLFYQDNKKIIPDAIGKILSDPLTLAVWFMDDGYYYGRDKTAYIYLSKLSPRDVSKLQTALEKNFKLATKLEIKKTGAMNLKFGAAETKKLVDVIAPHVIEGMRYKIGEEPRID